MKQFRNCWIYAFGGTFWPPNSILGNGQAILVIQSVSCTIYQNYLKLSTKKTANFKKILQTSTYFSKKNSLQNVTVLWREEGYTLKYCLSPKEIPRAPPSGFPSGSGNISLYTPTRVTIQLHSDRSLFTIYD